MNGDRVAVVLRMRMPVIVGMPVRDVIVRVFVRMRPWSCDGSAGSASEGRIIASQ